MRNCGKMVDCLAFTSKSGGITREILVEIFTHFNSIDLFPCVPGGPIPLLIVNGHGSCLAPVIVEYLNDKNQTWKICLAFHMPQLCGKLVTLQNRMEWSS
jgi:hypothetical protein